MNSSAYPNHILRLHEFNNDLGLLREIVEKGKVNEREVTNLTELIRKVGSQQNASFLGDVESEIFNQILTTLWKQYPHIYNQIKQAIQSDAYLRTNFFSEIPKAPTKLIANPSKGVSSATIQSAVSPLLAKSSSSGKADVDAFVSEAIASGELNKLQEACKLMDPNVILKKAFEAENASVCKWLIKQPGIKPEAINALPNKTAPQTSLKNWLLSFVNSGPINPAALNKVALEQGYGFKSGNLMVLKTMAEALNKFSHLEIRVPSFVPISHFEIYQHITKYDPGIFLLWESFKRTFKPDQVKAFLGSTQPASQQVEVTEQGKAVLEKIGARWKDLFQQQPLNTPEMQEWLHENPGKLIIVRSTGKEDSDELVNAGGNESIPFVKPDIASLNAAISRVIGSYFCDPNTNEPKSIQQRLAAGDKSLFTDPPFIPVLLQQMVMEDSNDPRNILRSGVLFTRPYAEMPHAILIQTGLGNNHGIVTSEVAVDSYTVENNRIQSVIRDKSTRFVHKEKPEGYVLEKVPNASDIATKQALSPGMVRDLAAAASRISTAYGGAQKKSMDMEYTIQADHKSGKQTLYLLQARPLKDAVGTVKHPKTYLDLQTLDKDSVKGKTLLDGNSYVREVTSNNQVVFAEDLNAALRKYLSSPNRNDIKAIVVKQKALLTSHEAVTLRPFGVPVIIISDSAEYDRARTLSGHASAAKPVYICPQRAALVSKQNFPTGGIKQGLVTFPEALEISVPVDPDLEKAVAAKDPKMMIAYMSKMEAHYQLVAQKLAEFGKMAPSKNKDERSLKALLDLAATGDKAQAGAALGSLLPALHSELVKTAKTTKSQMSSFEILAAFSAILVQIDRRIIPSLETTQPSSLERLYHLKPLDALIFQPSSEDIINGFSFRSALSLHKTSEMLEKEGLSKARPHAIALQLHSKSAISREFGIIWKLFVKNLENAFPAKVDALFSMVKDLDELQMTSLWMGLSSSMFDAAKPSETFDRLKKAFDANIPTFKWLKEQSQIADNFEHSTDQWADPAYCSKRMSHLTKTYRNWFEPSSQQIGLNEQYQKADPLGKLAVLQFLGRIVSAYDQIVKAVKGSDRFSIDKKLTTFAELLKTYSVMMDQAVKLIPKSMEYGLMSDASDNTTSFDSYIQMLHKGAEYAILNHEHVTTPGFDILCAETEKGNAGANQLEARPEFSVAAVQIGSKARYFEVRWPTTLEEYFTTFHQNMEAVKKVLAFENGLTTHILPPRAKMIVEELGKACYSSPSSIRFDNGRVEVDLIIPLSAHAATIRVSYDPLDPQESVDISILAYGNDEIDRWDFLAGALAIMGFSGPGISLSQAPKIDYRYPIGTEVTLKIAKTYQNIGKLSEQLSWLLTQMTQVYYDMSSLDVINKLARENFYNEKRVSPAALQYAPGFLNAIMDTALAKGDIPLAYKAAVSAFVGMAYQHNENYSNRSNVNQFKTAITLPSGEGYPDISHTMQLAANAQKCILKLWHDQKINPSDLDILLTDPFVQKSFPWVIANLKAATAYYSALDKPIKALAAADKPIEAILLFTINKKDDIKKDCIESINASLVRNMKGPQLKALQLEMLKLEDNDRQKVMKYIDSFNNSLGLKAEFERLKALDELASKQKFNECVNNIYNGFTTRYQTRYFPLNAIEAASHFLQRIYLYERYTDSDIYIWGPSSVDDEFMNEPYTSLVPDLPKTHPDPSGTNVTGNGYTLSLFCLVDALNSDNATLQAKAKEQIKILKAKIEYFDKSLPIENPDLEPERKLFKSRIDAIIKHFNL